SALQICARSRYNSGLVRVAPADRILARHRPHCQKIPGPTRDGEGRCPDIEACMATCPECDAEIEVDEFDVDKGDQLSCPECGSNLEVTGVSPIELDLAPDDDDDDDYDDELEDDDDLDDDEEGDEEDDEEGEDWEE